jgi:hypothetical protein
MLIAFQNPDAELGCVAKVLVVILFWIFFPKVMCTIDPNTSTFEYVVVCLLAPLAALYFELDAAKPKGALI